MRYLILLAFCVQTGCSQQSTHFAGIDPVRVTVLGSSFDLRRRQGRLDMVQVVRVNAEYAPRLSQQLGRRAEIAVEQTYGCPVFRVLGDTAVMIAYLKCGAQDDLARIGNGP